MKRGLFVAAVFGLVAIALTFCFLAPHGAHRLFSPGSPSNQDPSIQALNSANVAGRPQQDAAGDPAATASSKRARSAEAAAKAEAAARSLVTGLSQIDLTKPINYETADKWKQAFAELIAQGPAAIPAIREYLQKNEDINFSILRGGILLGEPSLRAALLDALHQIGLPESTGLMVETLKTSVTPTEIALLAGYLDQQAPGQ
jgi:hypothetical protein